MEPTQVNELIRRRRAVYPNSYNDRPIDRAILEEILTNANRAPTHKLTTKFRVTMFYFLDQSKKYY